MKIDPLKKLDPIALESLPIGSLSSPAFTHDSVSHDAISSSSSFREKLDFSSLKPSESRYTLVDFAEVAEAICHRLMAINLESQKQLAKQSLEDQELFHRELAKKKEKEKSLETVQYFQRIASHLFSVLSLIGGVTLMSTAPYLGSLCIASGSLSLSALTLESLGVSDSITRPLSLAGLSAGLVGSLIAGYIRPDLIQGQIYRIASLSTGLISSASSAIEHRFQSEIEQMESLQTDRQKDKELIKHQLDQLLHELSQSQYWLSTLKDAHQLIKKDEELKMQVLSITQQRG
jgi:hypothetical protein